MEKPVLTIPESIPADVLENVQRYLDIMGSIDEEGGTDKYGLFVLAENQSLQMVGVMSASLRDDIIKAIGVSVAMKNILGNRECGCARCVAARAKSAPAKTERKPTLMEKLFGVRK
jgi:hypothetical protein